jgi:hypothetical protein
MSKSKIQIKQIKNKLIKALTCQFSPLIILGILESFFKFPKFFAGITALAIFLYINTQGTRDILTF